MSVLKDSAHLFLIVVYYFCLRIDHNFTWVYLASCILPDRTWFGGIYGEKERDPHLSIFLTFGLGPASQPLTPIISFLIRVQVFLNTTVLECV